MENLFRKQKFKQNDNEVKQKLLEMVVWVLGSSWVTRYRIFFLYATCKMCTTSCFPLRCYWLPFLLQRDFLPRDHSSFVVILVLASLFLHSHCNGKVFHILMLCVLERNVPSMFQVWCNSQGWYITLMRTLMFLSDADKASNVRCWASALT